MKRLLRILHTHVFKIDVDRFTNNILSFINNSKTTVDNYKFEGLYNNIIHIYFLFYMNRNLKLQMKIAKNIILCTISFLFKFFQDSSYNIEFDYFLIFLNICHI